MCVYIILGKAINFSQGGHGVLRGRYPGDIPAEGLDENGYHLLGRRKSLIVGAGLTSLNDPLRQLDILQ